MGFFDGMDDGILRANVTEAKIDNVSVRFVRPKLTGDSELEYSVYDEGKVVKADKIIEASGFQVCGVTGGPAGERGARGAAGCAVEDVLRGKRRPSPGFAATPAAPCASNHSPSYSVPHIQIPMLQPCNLTRASPQRGHHYHVEDGYDAMNSIFACGLLEDINIEPEQDPVSDSRRGIHQHVCGFALAIWTYYTVWVLREIASWHQGDDCVYRFALTSFRYVCACARSLT